MAKYKIFQNPDGELRAVKEGWHWPSTFRHLFSPKYFSSREYSKYKSPTAAPIIDEGQNTNTWKTRELLEKGFVQIASIEDVSSEQGALIHYQARLNRQKRRQQKSKVTIPSNPIVPAPLNEGYNFSIQEYTIFENSEGALRAVKSKGWNGWAFLFDWIWGLAKGLPVPSYATLGLYLFLSMLSMAGASAGLNKFGYILIFIVKFIFALKANDWQKEKCLSEGYVKIATIEDVSSERSALVHYRARLRRQQRNS